MMKLDLELQGELTEKLQEYLDRPFYSSKPELVRDALRHLFEHLEEADLLRVRRNMIKW